MLEGVVLSRAPAADAGNENRFCNRFVFARRHLNPFEREEESTFPSNPKSQIKRVLSPAQINYQLRISPGDEGALLP